VVFSPANVAREPPKNRRYPMARSLTKRVAIRVGEYLVRQRQRNFAVQGASHTTEGRKFSLWKMVPGRWRANVNDLTGRHWKRFKAKLLVAAVEKADNLFFRERVPGFCRSIIDCGLLHGVAEKPLLRRVND
jgi:hypothetical protein